MLSNEVISIAQIEHNRQWRLSGDASEGTLYAKLITVAWQDAVMERSPDRFVKEYQVAPHLGEKIDLVDVVDSVAYELKVSPNNTAFEFYKDIFKVILARDNGLPNLAKFVFITPAFGASKIKRGLGQAVVEHSRSLGLEIEVHAI